jgi:hypothetical protein
MGWLLVCIYIRHPDNSVVTIVELIYLFFIKLINMALYFGQVVIGTAGSGKSTYCEAI